MLLVCELVLPFLLFLCSNVSLTDGTVYQSDEVGQHSYCRPDRCTLANKNEHFFAAEYRLDCPQLKTYVLSFAFHCSSPYRWILIMIALSNAFMYVTFKKVVLLEGTVVQS